MPTENTDLNQLTSFTSDNYIPMDSHIEKRSTRMVSFNTSSSNDYLTSEAYKTLRTNLLFCGTDIKTIIITSCQENEGKSTISTELSKSLAEIGKRTLLIDADMRKSVMLRKGTKGKNILGISEVLSGQASIDEVLFSTQQQNFDVIFSGHFPPNPVELLGNEKFKLLLDKLKSQYDYIIIDSPPLGAVIDAAVIASFCDGAILVITANKISYRMAQSVKLQLEKSGSKILGAVMNDVEHKVTKYYKKYYNNGEYK